MSTNSVMNLELLVNAGGHINSPNHTGNTAFMLAANMGHVEVMKALLAHNADSCALNANNENALWIAARDGHIEAVDFLLDINVDPDVPSKNQKTPLIAAVEARIIALLWEESRIVLGHGPPESPSENYIEIISALLTAGTTASTIDEDGFTPLIYAAFKNDIEVTRLLLPYDDNPGYTTPLGYSASIIANLNGDIKIVQLIQKAIDEKGK